MLSPSPNLTGDGVAGRNTRAAVDLLLKNYAKIVAGSSLVWPDQRRIVAAEQIIVKLDGIEAGSIDGLIGEQTRNAFEIWDARQKNGGLPVPAVETWRDAIAPAAIGATNIHQQWPQQKNVAGFYGTPDQVSDRMTTVTLPFPFRIAWEPATVVHRTSCHKLCANAFVGIWTDTLDAYGHERITQLRLDMFGGLYNKRRMRGGSAWSMHAYGCAWDIDPDRNQLKWHKENAELDGKDYDEFWKIVYRFGGLSLGREKNYDWMHFQFTRDFS